VTFPNKFILFSVYCRVQSSKNAAKCPKNGFKSILTAVIIGRIKRKNKQG